MNSKFTWGDIKLAAMKKADSSVTSLTKTRNTKDYINTAVDVANRGLQDLATTGKMLIKEYYIMIPQIVNMLDSGHETVQHYSEDIVYRAENAKSYYFEISGKGTVQILVENILFIEIKSEDTAGFKIYKGKISNPEGKSVTIAFSGLYPYQFRNVALYKQDFEEDADVWEYSDKRRFNLRELTDDFYMLETRDVVLMSNKTSYVKFSDYQWEGDDTLVLDGTTQGNYIVHYFAYPQNITDETADDFELSLDPEIGNILPLYMASQFIEEDDPSQSFYIRQQYEEAKSQLKATVRKGKPVFVDVRGW